MTNEELVKAVRKHAVQNYEHGGWDILVECWDNTDIVFQMGGATDLDTAVENCKSTLEVLDDIRRDIREA